jgi:hypothetical protein
MIAEEVVIEQEQQIVRAENNQLAEKDASNWIDLGWFNLWKFAGLEHWGSGSKETLAIFDIWEKMMKEGITVGNEVRVNRLKFTLDVAEAIDIYRELTKTPKRVDKTYRIKVRDIKGVVILPFGYSVPTPDSYYYLTIFKESEDIFMKPE